MDTLELIEKLSDLLEQGFTEIELHFQPSYPLKASLANVRLLNGKIVLALGPGTEYGSREAWEEGGTEDGCMGCGKEGYELDSFQQCAKCASEL